MSEARIAWALQDETIIHIDDVPPGLAAGCRCIECGGDLVAAHGKIRTPYFRHHKPEPNGCPLRTAPRGGERSSESLSGRVAVRIVRAALESIGVILLPGELQPCAIVDRHLGESIAERLVLDLLEVETSASGAPRTVAVEVSAARRLGFERLSTIKAIEALGEGRGWAIEQEMERRRALWVLVICGDPWEILAMSPQDLKEWLVSEGTRFWLPGAQQEKIPPARPIPETPRRGRGERPVPSYPEYPEAVHGAGLPAPVLPPWLAGLEPLEPPVSWPQDMDPLTRQRYMVWFAQQDLPLAEDFAHLPVYRAAELMGIMPPGLTTRMGLHMRRLVPGGDPVGWLVWVGQCVALFEEKKARRQEAVTGLV